MHASLLDLRSWLADGPPMRDALGNAGWSARPWTRCSAPTPASTWTAGSWPRCCAGPRADRAWRRWPGCSCWVSPAAVAVPAGRGAGLLAAAGRVRRGGRRTPLPGRARRGRGARRPRSGRGRPGPAPRRRGGQPNPGSRHPAARRGPHPGPRHRLGRAGPAGPAAQQYRRGHRRQPAVRRLHPAGGGAGRDEPGRAGGGPAAAGHRRAVRPGGEQPPS